MKRVLATVCCITLWALPAIGQKPMSDKDFVEFAGQTDMVEANLGQLAASNASAQAVKDYGTMLASDHTSDYQQLTAAANQANIKMPGSIDAAHQKALITPMHSLTGAAFDKRFATEMVAGHTKAIAIYKQESTNAKNPALQTYAQQALPTLEKHLKDAQGLQGAK